MAKQKGMFPLEGSLGGINFYFRKGKPVARAAGGGFNGDAIKAKPSMERVRENGSEFGMVARAKKLIRLSVAEDLLHAKDGELHGRMMGGVARSESGGFDFGAGTSDGVARLGHGGR